MRQTYLWIRHLDELDIPQLLQCWYQSFVGGAQGQHLQPAGFIADARASSTARPQLSTGACCKQACLYEHCKRHQLCELEHQPSASVSFLQQPERHVMRAQSLFELHNPKSGQGLLLWMSPCSSSLPSVHSLPDSPAPATSWSHSEGRFPPPPERAPLAAPLACPSDTLSVLLSWPHGSPSESRPCRGSPYSESCRSWTARWLLTDNSCACSTR